MSDPARTTNAGSDEEEKHQPGGAGGRSVRDEGDPSPGEQRGRRQVEETDEEPDRDSAFLPERNRLAGEGERPRRDDEVVDEASEESFPASDPPSYTGTTGG